MTITGSQLSNSGSGTGQSGNASGSVTGQAIKPVSGAKSNVANQGDAKPKDGDKDEGAAVGQGEKNSNLLSSANLSALGLKNVVSRAVSNLLPIASPAAFGMLGPRVNPLAGLFPSAFGGVGGRGWDQAAVAASSGNDLASGGGYSNSSSSHIQGNIQSEGISEVASSTEKPAGISGKFTVVNSTSAYQVSWMNGGGNFASQYLRNQVLSGKTLGETLLQANNVDLGSQALVTAGEGVSRNLGTSENPVKAIIGIIDYGHYEHGHWFAQDFSNGVDIARASGLQDESKIKSTNDPALFRAGLRELALANAAAGGGGTLLVVSGAHGGSDQNGNDNKSATSGFSVRGQWYGEHQYEADIAAAKVLGRFDNVVVINNPCYSGGFDGNPLAKNESVKPQSLEQEPKKETDTLMAERSDEEKRKQELENRLQVEIA